MRLNRFFSLLLVACLTLCVQAVTRYAVKDVPNVQQRDRTKLCSNPDGVLSPATTTQLDSLLVDLRRKASAEVAVVVLEDIASDDIDSFATELFSAWGIGKKDKNNGVLLIVAKESRQVAIRTGYGAEGVLPDILCGRIIRDKMIPAFKRSDYDAGVLAGVDEIHRLMTNPDAVAELMSEAEDELFFSDYVHVSVIITLLLAAWLLLLLIYIIWNKVLSPGKRHKLLTLHVWVYAGLGLFLLGLPLLLSLLLLLVRYYYRNQPHRCPRCQARMKKLDEASDNAHLSAAQDLEERLQSVDYDVWLCPACGETVIEQYVESLSGYAECSRCHARTEKQVSKITLRHATQFHSGVEELTFQCAHCGALRRVRRTLPRITSSSGGLGGGGLSGGGLGGGGFGGGFTGGGGASGRW